MFFWWRDVVRESRIPGLYTPVVRLGLRYGMMFFICSEVMFFVAFFWAFFNYALFPENVAGLAIPMWPPPTIHSPDPFHFALLNDDDPAAFGHHDHLGAPQPDRG